MTERLYYKDAYETTFEADVIEQGKDEHGQYVILNRTAFYPTGGGQPYDTGYLNNSIVHNVEEIDGVIRHYIDTPLEEEHVIGVIDWERRFDYMQQHSAQHIVTAIFHDILGYETDSFHLGDEVVTIDLMTEQVSRQEMMRAEQMANEVVLRNIPIETHWVTKEELENYPLRSDIKAHDNIRLVIIPDIDYNGCGGTHPRATNEIQLIKLLGTERMKKRTRLSFIAGRRALVHYALQNERVKRCAQLLETSESRVVPKIERWIEEKEAQEQLIRNMRKQLLDVEATELLQSSEQLITATFKNRPLQEIQALATKIVEQRTSAVVLFTTTNDELVQLIAMRGEDALPNMREFGKEIFPLFEGRGGGSPKFIQGGGPKVNISAQQLLDEMITRISLV